MIRSPGRGKEGATWRSLGPATLVVAAGVVAAKSVGFAKELYIANQLGAGPELDVFLIAYLFPTFAFGVLAGAIQSATVPAYLACKAREGNLAARRMVAEGGLIVILLLALVTVLMLPVAFGVLPAVTSGFSQSAQEHVGRLLPWLMPLLVLTCLASYCAGILNAEGRFGLAAFVPAVTPLCVALSLLVLPGLSGSSRLAIGTMTGALLELGFVIFALRILGFRLLGAVPAWSGHWRQVSGQFLSMVGASTLMALTMFVDQSFAARLDVGSVSVLSYGTKLGGVTASMLVVVVSTLALPVMSRMAAANDWQGMQRTLLRSSAVLLVVTVVVAFILAVAARPIIEALFLHGAFTTTAAENAARVQFFHAWHIPFYVLGTVALRALVALRLSHIAVLGSGINLATNIVTNIAAAPVLGVAGVALATTMMYAASCMFLSWFAIRELQRRRNMNRAVQG